MSVTRKLILLLILVPVLCSGCWDRKEFNQLAIAQAIAIDYEDNQYQLTIQLVMPAASDAEISGSSMWLITGQGNSVAEALEQISRSAPRELYLNHLDIVLLGEGLLQNDIKKGISYLIQEDVLRRRTSLLAVKGKAGDILQAKLKLADVDVYYLRNLLRDQRQWVKGGDALINDYNLAMEGMQQEALLIPRIEVKEEKALALNGAALIKENRLFCWINQERLDCCRWITGGAEICTLPPSEEHGAVTVEVRKEPCRWKLVSNQPLKVQSVLQGTLIVTENDADYENRTIEERQVFYQQVQQEAEQMLTERVMKEFAELQEIGCDCLRLGRWLRAWHPNLADVTEWEKQFAATEIEVKLILRLELDA